MMFSVGGVDWEAVDAASETTADSKIVANIIFSSFQ